MSKNANYKNYAIRSTPVQHPDSMQWTLAIAIYSEHNGLVTMRPFSTENTFQTEEEADLRGITFGQSIIDGTVPGLSVD
jgi:hypothetical protein